MQDLRLLRISSSVLLLFFFLCFIRKVFSRSGVQWPAGKYGLPMAKTGCPSATGFQWDSGFIYQDLENNNTQTTTSTSFHLQGKVNGDVLRHFCIKNNASNTVDSTRSDWPKGQYCIYKKGSVCPPSLQEGWVLWDDDNGIDGSNMNNNSGAVPNGTYKSDTKIFFCCQTEGSSAKPISLPIDKPFYLVAFTKQCQEVWRTIHTTEYIRYDTENDNNHDNTGHIHPYGAQLPNPYIYYCYYQACVRHMTALTGTFSSIGYPDKFYKDNTWCEWHINVPQNYFISLTFDDLRLEWFSKCANCTCDYVEVHETFTNGTSVLREKYCMGDKHNAVNSTSNRLTVVFRSDNNTGFRGFKATYHSFPLPGSSTGPFSTTPSQSTTLKTSTTGDGLTTNATTPSTLFPTTSSPSSTDNTTLTTTETVTGTSPVTNTGTPSTSAATASIAPNASSTTSSRTNETTSQPQTATKEQTEAPPTVTTIESRGGTGLTTGVGIKETNATKPTSRVSMVIVAVVASLILITGGLVVMSLCLWKKRPSNRGSMKDRLRVNFTATPEKTTGFSNVAFEVYGERDNKVDQPRYVSAVKVEIPNAIHSVRDSIVNQPRYVDVNLEGRNVHLPHCNRRCRTAVQRTDPWEKAKESRNPLYDANRIQIVQETENPLYQRLNTDASNWQNLSKDLSVDGPIYEKLS